MQSRAAKLRRPGPFAVVAVVAAALASTAPGCWLKTSNFPDEMRAHRECLKQNPGREEACDEAHAKAAAEYDRYERNAKQVFACPPDEACQPHR